VLYPLDCNCEQGLAVVGKVLGWLSLLRQIGLPFVQSAGKHLAQVKLLRSPVAKKRVTQKGSAFFY